MANGGKRKGAGRKPGGKNKKTLEQKAVQDAFNQRVMNVADALFNAQLSLAIGSVKVFRVDKVEGENGKTKKVHVLVTDADEIKDVLDETEGEGGTVGDCFYLVTDVAPYNKAIDSMLNRALGKPTESLDIGNKDGKPFETKYIVEVVNDSADKKDSDK